MDPPAIPPVESKPRLGEEKEAFDPLRERPPPILLDLDDLERREAKKDGRLGLPGLVLLFPPSTLFPALDEERFEPLLAPLACCCWILPSLLSLPVDRVAIPSSIFLFSQAGSTPAAAGMRSHGTGWGKA